MPVLFLRARDAYDFSMQHWSHAWSVGQHAHRWVAGAAAAERVFVYMFPSWLMLDFVLVEVRPLMLIHHVVCLVGHGIATLGVPVGFPFYFAACVALELGSACCNLLCIWPRSRLALEVYMVGMTLSNAAALVLMAYWVRAVRPNSVRAIGIGITVALAFVREREACKAMAVHLEMMPS